MGSCRPLRALLQLPRGRRRSEKRGRNTSSIAYPTLLAQLNEGYSGQKKKAAKHLRISVGAGSKRTQPAQPGRERKRKALAMRHVMKVDFSWQTAVRAVAILSGNLFHAASCRKVTIEDPRLSSIRPLARILQWSKESAAATNLPKKPGRLLQDGGDVGKLWLMAAHRLTKMTA